MKQFNCLLFFQKRCQSRIIEANFLHIPNICFNIYNYFNFFCIGVHISGLFQTKLLATKMSFETTKQHHFLNQAVLLLRKIIPNGSKMNVILVFVASPPSSSQ